MCQLQLPPPHGRVADSTDVSFLCSQIHGISDDTRSDSISNSVIRLLLFVGTLKLTVAFKIMRKPSPEHHVTKLKQLRSTVRGFLWLNPLASKQQIIDLLVDSRPGALLSCFSSIFSEFSDNAVITS